MTTLPPSCADCLEIWEAQPPGTLAASPGLYRDCCTFVVMNISYINPMRSDDVTVAHVSTGTLLFRLRYSHAGYLSVCLPICVPKMCRLKYTEL